jgi:hypothetical protein
VLLSSETGGGGRGCVTPASYGQSWHCEGLNNEQWGGGRQGRRGQGRHNGNPQLVRAASGADDGVRDDAGMGPDIRRPFLLVRVLPRLHDPEGDALSLRDSAVPAGSRRRLVRGERAGGGGRHGQRAPT